MLERQENKFFQASTFLEDLLDLCSSKPKALRPREGPGLARKAGVKLWIGPGVPQPCALLCHSMHSLTMAAHLFNKYPASPSLLQQATLPPFIEIGLLLITEWHSSFRLTLPKGLLSCVYTFGRVHSEIDCMYV